MQAVRDMKENAKTIYTQAQTLQRTLATGIEKSLDRIDNTIETNKIRALLSFIETKTRAASTARYSLAKTSDAL